MRDKTLAKTKDLRTLPVVFVSWEDAASTGGWRTFADQREDAPVKCRTVGFLIKSTDKIVQVVQSIGESGKVSDSILIPRAMVRGIKVIRPGQQKGRK